MDTRTALLAFRARNCQKIVTCQPDLLPKLNVRRFGLRRAPPVQMMTNKARLANRFSTTARLVRSREQRRK